MSPLTPSPFTTYPPASEGPDVAEDAAAAAAAGADDRGGVDERAQRHLAREALVEALLGDEERDGEAAVQLVVDAPLVAERRPDHVRDRAQVHRQRQVHARALAPADLQVAVVCALDGVLPRE